MSENQDLKARAEALFKAKLKASGEAAYASEDYETRCRAIAEKTRRLRELRLAKEAVQGNRIIRARRRGRGRTFEPTGAAYSLDNGVSVPTTRNTSP
jgi:hypothetical protein